MKRYVKEYKIDVKKCDNNYIRHWKITTTDMIRKLETKKINDMQ